MFIEKVADGVYQVRLKKSTRPLFRGTLKQCVNYMNTNRPEPKSTWGV